MPRARPLVACTALLAARLAAIPSLGACVGAAVVDAPAGSTDVVDTDRLDDTDQAVVDTDIAPDPIACEPREIAWRAANAPVIGLLAGGGIAWHPSTGLRTWGGSELSGPSNTGYPEFSIGFGTRPWAIPAERWRSLFSTSASPCMVHRDGQVGCRADDGVPLPQAAVVLGWVGEDLCWIDPSGQPGCRRADVRTQWPSASGLGVDLVSLASGSKYYYGNRIPFVCALDERGRAHCDGPSDVVGPFNSPDRCWVELVGEQYGLCGIDSEGLTTCRNESYLDDNFADLTPSRQDLSHLSVSVTDACALDPEGHVVCWGLNVGPPSSIEEAAPKEGGFVDVVVTGGAVCALSGAGRVVCWGDERDPLVFDQPDRAP